MSSGRRRRSVNYAQLAGGDEAQPESEDPTAFRAGSEKSTLRTELLQHYERGRSGACATRPAGLVAEFLRAEPGRPVKFTGTAQSGLFTYPVAGALTAEGLPRLLGGEAEVPHFLLQQ